MTKVAVRVDGGSNIGLGHIQRSLALSSQLKKNGAKISFISKKNKLIDKKIKQEGFEVIVLKGKIGLKEDLKDTINIIKSRGMDVMITDSYGIDERYLTEIKKTVPLLVSVDDLAKIPFPSDIVINQNIYAQKLQYHSSTGRTKFLLGPKFALLRSGYSNLGKRKINLKVGKILVTLGGADFFNLTPQILKVLDRINQNFSITLVIGTFFANQAQIMGAMHAVANRTIKLIHFTDKFHQILFEHDLAITGGGSTAYALAATGTPAMSFCLADNQERNVQSLASYGSLVNLGWGNRVNEAELRYSIEKLIDDFPLRQKMAKLGQALVDGNGAKRICSIIQNENREEGKFKNNLEYR